MAKRKGKKNDKVETAMIVLGAVGLIGGLYLLWRCKSGGMSGFSGVYGSTCRGCVKGLSPSKARAHRWLEAQMEYQGEDPIEHQLIDSASGMEINQMGEFAKVLHRSYGQAVTHDLIPWNGIGRPEW